MSERIEQRHLLRAEPVPGEAVVVVRGGPNTLAKLRQHAARTALLWDLDGEPLFGVSAFCAVDEVGPASLAGLLSRMNSYPIVHLTTVELLERAGFELLATASRPHFTIRTVGADLDEIAGLLAVFGAARDNEYRSRRSGGR